MVMKQTDHLSTAEQEQIRTQVRQRYGQIAETGSSCASTSCCNNSKPTDLAKQVGYTDVELANLPEGANLGLSCGNPTAIASLKLGETVLDLGSGGGFDVFIAARKVGATGLVIGVDMTPEMLAKARHNSIQFTQQSGLKNVDFRLGEIEHLPVADSSVDVIISNCVINLSANKPQVWGEISRVLKPGGRVAVSDIALLKPLPPEVLKLVTAYVGCIAGAVQITDTERMASEAGLTEIVLKQKSEFIESLSDSEDPLYFESLKNLPPGTKPADYVTSLEITARKTSATSPNSAVESTLYTPAVAELVALGAAIAANCEPCFKYHYNAAQKLGVSAQDMANAVSMAQKVKQAPAKAVLELAERFLHGDLTPTQDSSCCPGTQEQPQPKKSCCS